MDCILYSNCYSPGPVMTHIYEALSPEEKEEVSYIHFQIIWSLLVNKCYSVVEQVLCI